MALMGTRKENGDTGPVCLSYQIESRTELGTHSRVIPSGGLATGGAIS